MIKSYLKLFQNLFYNLIFIRSCFLQKQISTSAVKNLNNYSIYYIFNKAIDIFIIRKVDNT